MILLNISLFLLLLLKKCIVMLSLTTNRQCLFPNVCLSRCVRKRETRHDSLLCKQQLLLRWCDKKKQCSKLCGCKQEMCFYQITKHITRTYLTLHAHSRLPAILRLTVWQKHWRLRFVVPQQKARFFPKWVLNDIIHFITKLSFLTPAIRIWSLCKIYFIWQKVSI